MKQKGEQFCEVVQNLKQFRKIIAKKNILRFMFNTSWFS